VRSFLVQTFYIPSESTERTLLVDDHVLVNKMVYAFREPRRGEIVVFEPPGPVGGRAGDKPSEASFDVTVGPGHVFVLGDHRSDSGDSRAHLDFESGTVPVSRVVGRAFVTFWPLARIRRLSVPATFAAVPHR
jgi:signal peptidase I